MLSRRHGSVAADIGGMVRGEAPQLVSTSLPWKDTGEAAPGSLSGVVWAGAPTLRADLMGAIPLN